MADLVFLVLIVGFFALMVLLVRACDHIIGPDPAPAADPTAEPAAGSDDAVGTTAVRS